MGVYQEIHNALTQSIIDLSLGLPIALENNDFDTQKEGGNQFLDLSTITNIQDSLDKTLFDEVTGIFQISIYTKSGEGIGLALDAVDPIINLYKHNLNLINGSQCVVVINAGRNEGRNIDGWYIIDVSVSFKSDIAR